MLTLKVLAPLLIAAGSLLLAIRVKIFLDAYNTWHKVTDLRLTYLERGPKEVGEARLTARPAKEWFPERTRWAGALFFIGFGLLVVGSLLTAYSSWGS